MLRRWQGIEPSIKMQRGLLGLVAVGDQPAEELDQEVVVTAVSVAWERANPVEQDDPAAFDYAAEDAAVAPSA